jgi:hypothetical protein
MWKISLYLFIQEGRQAYWAGFPVNDVLKRQLHWNSGNSIFYVFVPGLCCNELNNAACLIKVGGILIEFRNKSWTTVCEDIVDHLLCRSDKPPEVVLLEGVIGRQ